ncbi:MAG: acyltransferase family protein [Clostridia bacterium]|nr:hypothetical protein [Oscillospiraceae bacterium]MBQ7004856.1 acyltransferase family protein [Clostridia bacterium]
MAEQLNKPRVVWLDLLRVIATCMVPLAHLCSNCWNLTAGVHSTDYITLNFFSAMCRWVVPVFVMISGVFFLNPSKPCDPKKIFRKNVVRMATAFLFWSFLYALQWTLFRPHAQTEVVQPFSKKFFLSELIVGEYHMWYLYMIALLYLLTPLIRVFSDNATKKQLEAFMVLSFVFAHFIPMILQIPFIKQFTFDDVYEDLNIGFIGGYVGVYIAGQYMTKYPFRKNIRKLVYILGVLGYAITVFGNLWISFQKNKSIKDMLGADLGCSVMIAYAMFTFFQNVVSKIEFKEKTVKIIKWLSARSFGVYLCHVFVMRAFQYFGIQVIHISPEHATVDMSFMPYIHIPPIIGVPVLTTLVIIGSFIVSWVISKIPLLKKYVV